MLSTVIVYQIKMRKMPKVSKLQKIRHFIHSKAEFLSAYFLIFLYNITIYSKQQKYRYKHFWKNIILLKLYRRRRNYRSRTSSNVFGCSKWFSGFSTHLLMTNITNLSQRQYCGKSESKPNKCTFHLSWQKHLGKWSENM